MKIERSIKKKMINGKERWDFVLQAISLKKRTVYFIQGDSNIWWKPKKLIKQFDNSHGKSIGWLFVQIGYLTFD